MKKNINSIILLGVAILVFASGCGGSGSSDFGVVPSTSGGSNEPTPTAGNESNIPYLKSNHNNYSSQTSENNPAPVKDMDALSISWAIKAKTETDAEKLYDHINFMINELKNGKNPRAWDKLFLLEAFMKTAHRYTTVVDRNNTNIRITKTATDRCAYKVISAHSDAVSGDFFGQGIINKDYSAIAEEIIGSNDCSTSKTALEKYIVERLQSRGMQ